MKKETKWTLLSFPVIYLLLAIVSILLSVILDGGRCAAGWSLSRECGFSGLIYASFINALLLSVYFFPAYIVVPLITFFFVRHSRIKHQVMSPIQTDVSTQQTEQNKKIITKTIIRAIIIVLIFFTAYYWLYLMGVL
jgi:purine-cytosine permease-like protein